GTLVNEVNILVKRLSKSSRLSELQHRNLVRLLGFCLQGRRKDTYPAKKVQLDWTFWYKIHEGIARPMLHLHQDLHLTVIHCDLKASNILLDAYMNPKVKDVFVETCQENTSMTVGSYCYMSPECAMHSHFSMKSDVYCLGVLLLEIIRGRKNSNIYKTDNDAHHLIT
ncbi:hypothetical protein N665_0093s0072, partial [Sinapis alba]